MTPYTERRIAGYYEPDGSEPGWPPGRAPRTTEPDETNGPDLRSHAGLDLAAIKQGHTWTAIGLTAQEKREELANLE